jgi:hypothetical protein
MSAPFTEEEIQAAVEQIVRSAIRRPYGALGQRGTDRTFADFQEQTIAVLTLTPNAPFYVVRLGTERLVANILDMSVTIEQLDEAVQGLGRPSTPVASITSLANAKVAADALAVAAGSRNRAFSDMEQAPAFQRLDRNIEQFLTDYSAPNIRRSGQIVVGAGQARAQIPGLVRQLIEQRATLIGKVQHLADAISDYEALNLPGLLSGGVVERAAQVIADRTEQMRGLTPETRLSLIRSVTLDLLAARTIIRNFGSLRTPTAFVVLDGTGQPMADTTHPAVSARLVADLPGPYATRATALEIRNQLDFLVDGTFRTVAATGNSFVAELTGISVGPFEITATPPRNDQFELVVVNAGVTTTLLVTLTTGTRTVAQVVADINAAVTVEPIIAEAAIVPLKFQGKVDIAGADPAAVTFTSTNPFSSWVSIGIREGDRLRVLEGANLGVIYQVNVGGITALTLTCTRLTGAGTTAELNRTIEVGGPNQVVRVRLTDAFAATALANRATLGVGNIGTDAASQDKARTAATLGFSPGSKATSRSLPAQNVADAVNAATTTAVLDQPRIEASVETRALTISNQPAGGFKARTEPSAPTRLICYRFRGRGDCTVGGTTATFVVPGLTGQGVAVGDFLMIRASSVGADVGKAGIVLGSTGDSVVATFAGPGVSVTTNVLVEAMPQLTALPIGSVATIADGLNAGTYTVASLTFTSVAFGPQATELELDRPLQSLVGFSGQPVLMVAELGRQYLAFESTDETLVTAMQVDDGSPANPNSGASLFFAVRPTATKGTTVWFRLPEAPRDAIEPGDVLELFRTQYNVPTQQLEVVGFDTDTLVLEVAAGIPVDAGNFGFTAGSPIPNARIRKTRHDTFDAFASDASAWLARPQFQPSWLTELDRLVTICLSEPTPPNTTALRLFLVATYGLLTVAGAEANQMDQTDTIEQIAETYTAPVVSEVDTLVESLHGQGGDRAVDVLLDARFSDYFGLGQEGMSYAGQVLAATRDIARNDLPVRATRRNELTNRQVTLAEFEEPDFEFDQSDIDNSLVPDSPLPNPAPGEGDSY